ncbi:MAG: hypothetical protein IJ608_03225 [Lachnospiraceae bacterium]|nr:hypothetical protein [Lachnospiraceae bacterium]
MKKRNLFFTGVMLVMTALAGCGNAAEQKAPAEQAPEPVVQERPAEQEVGMANPWREITAKEAAEAIPNLFKAPDGAEVLAWTMLDDAAEANGKPGSLVDLQFSMDDLIFDARAQVTGDEYMDLSGLNYEWTAEDETTLSGWGGGNMSAKTYRNINDSGMIDLITWYDTEVGISYSLSVAAADLEGFDIQAVAEQMYDPSKQAGADTLDEAKEHIPRDISGCDTFTQIVNTLENGAGYANTTIDGVDVILIADQVYELDGGGTGRFNAIDAEVYYYSEDGVPTYAGYVAAAGTAYPLAVSDGKLFVCSGHFVRKMVIADGKMVSDEEVNSPDDSRFNELFGQYEKAEVIEFSKVQ